MHSSSFTSLVIVVVAAFLTPILLHRFKLNMIPVVIGEIIVGLILGKSGFDLIDKDTWLTTLSTLGFIFLMFLSGLEIDFSAFSSSQKKVVLPSGKKEPNRLMISLILFLGIFIVSVILSYGFMLAGLIHSVFFMTIVISTISLGVVVPTLKEAQISKTSIGQIILLVAVIADLVSMILLAIFVSISGQGGNVWLLLVLFAAGVILYFLAKQFKHLPFLNNLSSGTVQIGTRAVFMLIIVLVGLSESVGAENILGAFLAGTLVSLLSPNKELVRQLDSFGYGFFIPIFFVMVGVDLDVWSLFNDKKILIFIPLLIIAFFISKFLPVLLLKKWFDTKTVMSSSFLLTSTLSLVIAAAKVGERMEIITAQMSGTLVLVAVVTCIIAPIIFKKLFPKEKATIKKIHVALIGANELNLTVARELNADLYDTVLYHIKNPNQPNRIVESTFDVRELDAYDTKIFEENEIYDAEIIVCMTGDEDTNKAIALEAKQKGAERVIARIETPGKEKDLLENKVEVFSTLTSTQAIFQALIETPKVMDILTSQETPLHEIKMLNQSYDGVSLRKFPFTGDVIFVRIYRGQDSIVPHGDTELHLNDRLIMTGSKEYVDELKRELELT